MAQKTLQAVVVIGGRVDNSFGQIGSALVNMGVTIDGVSQKLIDFGKDSIQVYRDYQDSMLDAEVALSTTYGRGSRELQEVMDMLDVQATEWAASTIFHTNDVSNAISEAAHANWDLDKILTGIPAAMELAQAGSLDLSQALNYIIKASNAAGISFDDMGEFIDEWTFSANRSAGDVESFGDAMLRMGSTMRFAQNKEELLTLIAVMHDAGTDGAEAGTMIRNSMIRLVAPTDKAKKAFDALGATAEETAGLMEDEALAAAGAELAAHGFSAYDQSGKLKPILEIYGELYEALGDIAGGYENISSNEKSIDILSSIFPTRSITGALNMLNRVRDNYGDLYDDLAGGKAAGYGGYAAETMMSGVTGAVETFGSKVERLKQLVGAELEPQVTAVTGWAGDLVDSIATMDDNKFSALVGGVEVVAAAGPGLILAGGAFRLLGMLLTPTGAIAAGALTVAALAGAMHQLNEANFRDNFGDMDLDTETLGGYLATLGEDFNTAYTHVDAFRNALDGAVKSYQTASTEFSSRMLTDMLTGKELTEDDLSVYQGYGKQMHDAVLAGMQASVDASAEYWALLFGSGENPDYAADPAFQGIVDILRASYDQSVGEVEEIGKGLREAINKAFEPDENGVVSVSQQEYENILAYFDAYNAAIARAQKESEEKATRIERQKMLHKAQTLSYDAMQEFITGDVMTQRQAELDKSFDYYNDEVSSLEVDYQDLIANETDPQKRREWSDKLAAGIAAAEEAQQRREAEIYAGYDQLIFDMTATALGQSDLGYIDDLLGQNVELARIGAFSEKMTWDTLGMYGRGGDVEDIYRYYQDAINWLGGEQHVADQADYYERNGNATMAQQMRDLLDKYSLAYAYANRSFTSDLALMNNKEIGYNIGSASDAMAWLNLMEGTEASYIPSFLAAVGRSTSAGDGIPKSYYDALTGAQKDALKQVVEQLSTLYDFDAVLDGVDSPWAREEYGGRKQYGDYLAAWQLMNMSPDEASRYDYTSERYRSETILPLQTEVNSLQGVIDSLDSEIAAAAARIQEIGFNPFSAEYREESANLKELKKQRQDAQSQLEAAQGNIDAWRRIMGYGEGVGLQFGDEEITDAKAQLTDTINPLDVVTAYPGIEEDAAAAHRLIQGQFPPITQTITIKTMQATVTATTAATTKATTPVKGGGGGNYTYLAQYAEGGRSTEAAIFGEGLTAEWAIPEEHTPNTAYLLMQAAEASGFTLEELVTIANMNRYETGGRSTEAAIFGEGSTAEWAIPEAHTPNTAYLLTQAAEASGFEWGELTSSSSGGGGGSAGESGPVIQVEYSPVIHADNAQGVEKALKDDKERFERMLEEWYAKRELYDSVVKYR